MTTRTSPPVTDAMKSGEEGAALVTTLLLLMLMSLCGFMLLQFAGLDIRLSGSDRYSRTLLYRVETCALYGVQTLLNLDPEHLLPGNPEKPSWIQTADDILDDTTFGLSGKKDLSTLSDREFLRLMEEMDRRDLLSTDRHMLSLADDTLFPFLGGGRGKILIVDCGQASSGSQDLGGPVFRKYLLFAEYRDARNEVRFLELGLLRKV